MVKTEISIELKEKIDAYAMSLMDKKYEEEDTRKACRYLEQKLDIETVEPRMYRFLHAISETLEKGKSVDLSKLARRAGYPRWMASKPETAILRNIDDKLFDEIIGIDRKLIQRELRKMVEQDDEPAVKMRALELSSKIMGMQESEGTKVQVNFPSNVTLGD